MIWLRLVRRSFTLLAVLSLIASFAIQAKAQQPTTRIYGLAYESVYYTFTFTYWPICDVTVWDDHFHVVATVQSNWKANWWLDNVPANHWYYIQARSEGAYVHYSSTWLVYVAQRPWPNETRMPDLVCR